MEKSTGRYVPDRGDFIWLSFSPQAGHEQAGRRPALCLSLRIYNEKTGLGLFCPVTTRRKGYPFEVVLPSGMNIKGLILFDQVRSLDWRSRHAVFMEKIPDQVLNEVLEKLRLLFF